MEMTETVDQIFLSLSNGKLFIMTDDEQIAARQNGNQKALDYILERYSPGLASKKLQPNSLWRQLATKIAHIGIPVNRRQA